MPRPIDAPTTSRLFGGPVLAQRHAEALAGRLVQEMVRRWGEGERPLAEEFLARHPELWGHPEAAADLIYEELCLRRQYGQQVPAEQVLQRFPQWRAQLEVLFNCQWLLEEPAPPPAMPAAGEVLGDFLLLTEIGRGGHGSVFLATQRSLGHRPVVLKLTPCTAEEHLSLARLQHPFIVPLHSAQDYPERRLRALCMPYFGGATLAQLLAALQSRPPGQRSGQDLLTALDRLQSAGPRALLPCRQARQIMARASYVQAVCWIGACLAEALQYAHERGLVHLDLKPSNVLLTAEGLPMLLDFHLARPPLVAGCAPPFWFGGTGPYMSPEQRAVWQALERGQGICLGVDGRSDVYSLGLVLYEALSGSLPLPWEAVPRLRNPQVSPGLADVLGKCLAFDPQRRYPDMAALADDLRRHLADQPLRGVRNRSLGERWRKWRRRHPNRLALLTMLLVVFGAACAVLTAAAAHLVHRADQARAALHSGQAQVTEGRHAEAVVTFQRGQSLARGIPFLGSLAQDLEQQARHAAAEATRARALRELRSLTAKVRRLQALPSLSDEERCRLEECCRALSEKRELILRGQAIPASPQR